MPKVRCHTVPHSLQPGQHPYTSGAWTPLFEECDAEDLEVIGDIPQELDGVYFRNTENPLHEPIGLYHPFDGDGMIHSMAFRDGRAVYRSRFVRTSAFLEEQAAGRSCGRVLPKIRGYPNGRAGGRMAALRMLPRQTWSSTPA
jgi:carotenoid cleavage dioxygenase-like enzyme